MFIKISDIKTLGSWIPITMVTAILLLFTGNFQGCEPEDWMLEVNCNDCYGFKPDSASLIVYLTINAENDSVPLAFYKGDYEEGNEGNIDWRDTATTEELYLKSEINAEYTVVATYRSGHKTIRAIDGDKMFLYNASDECGTLCYIVKGGIFDVRLME
jgi:hypothetical protein